MVPAAGAVEYEVGSLLTDSRTISRFEAPFSPAHAGEIRVSSVGGTIWLVSASGRLARYSGTTAALDHEWPLPAGLRAAEAGSLGIAAVDRDAVWLVDRDRASFQLFDHGVWHEPFTAGDRIGGLTARPDRSLVINTPWHSTYAFAVISPSGKVLQRFGGRLSSQAGALEHFANTWVLATGGNGDLIAAHAYRNLVRRYGGSETMLRWEMALALPSLEPLDLARAKAEAEVRSNPQTCCIEAKLIHYATQLLVRGESFAICYGFNSKIDVFDGEGRWLRTISVNTPPDSRGWLTAGVAFARRGVFAFELQRLAIYEPSRSGGELRGIVVDPDGKGVAEARVDLQAGGGAPISVRSGSDGTLTLRGLPTAGMTTLTVNAGSFLPLIRSGTLPEILSTPLRLERQPKICLSVRDDNERAVARFHLEIGRSESGASTVTRSKGPAVDVVSDDGRTCLDSPFPMPLYVRVGASGFAAREVTVSSSSQPIEVHLAPEARLQIHVRSEDDKPIAQARLLIFPGSDEKRLTYAINDDMTGVTDEDGIATFVALAAADYRVVVEHPRYLSEETKVSTNEGSNEITVRLSGGTTIAVTVNARGSRVPNASVRAEGAGQSLAHSLECTTAADGTCTIDGVAPGRYFIRAQAAGQARGQQRVSIAAAERSVAVSVDVTPAVALIGHVHGIENYPGTTLAITVAKPGVPSNSAAVSASGEFRMSEAPSGSISLWVIEHGTTSSLLFQRLEIPNDIAEFAVDLDLPPPLTLHGRITSSDGGCGACTLALERQGGEIGQTVRAARMLPDGSYTVALPNAGSWRATARDPQTGGIATRLIDVSVDAVADFSIGGSSLRITVRTAGGDALAALVDISKDGATVADLVTDVSGIATFPSLTAGDYRVTASAGGRAASRQIAVSGETALDIRLPNNRALKLRVVDARSAIPLTLIWARVISAAGEVAIARLTVETDGMFTLTSFEAEPLTIVLSATGYGTKTIRGIHPSEQPITIPLTPDGRSFSVEVAAAVTPCSLEIDDARGQPIAISTSFSPGPFPFSVRRAAFNGIESGNYIAVLRDCNGRPFSVAMTLLPGSTPIVRFP